MLDRQRQSFLAAGPPSVEVRRNRIDRLMALLLDNTDAFIEAMAADYRVAGVSFGLASNRRLDKRVRDFRRSETPRSSPRLAVRGLVRFGKLSDSRQTQR